jgi:hypothetical protein
MIIGDLLLDRRPTDKELRGAFANILDLSMEHVVLVDSMADASTLTGATIEVTDLEGDFPRQVGIYVAEAHVATLTDVATKLAIQLQAKVLIPDDSPDPYEMILIDPSGTTIKVNIDTSSLDELGQYKLAT